MKAKKHSLQVKFSYYWLPLVVILLSMVCYAIATRIVNSIDYRNNDFFTFWLAGHMVTRGGAPYSPEQWIAGHHEFGVSWIPNNAYIYPLPLSLLFAPLGLLSLYQAYILWVALSQLMIVGALFLLISLKEASGVRFLWLPVLVGMIFFRPAILTLFNGQLSGWLLLLLALTLFLWEKEKWFWGGLLLSLLALKPNIGGPLILLLSIWLLSRKQFKSLAGILGGGAILLALSFIQDPHWVAEYWQVGNTKLAETFGGSPTVWGLAALACRNRIDCVLPIGGMAALLLLAGFGGLVLKFRLMRPLTVASLAITLTLLITPYTWTYDQLLLVIPIILTTLAMDHPGPRRLLASSLFLFIDLVVVILLFFDVLLQVEILNAVVPLIVLVLLVLSIRFRRSLVISE
jgi:Glycosyltransferase family 87